MVVMLYPWSSLRLLMAFYIWDVAYLFGEFAKKFVQFLDVCFGEGDCIVGISYT